MSTQISQLRLAEMDYDCRDNNEIEDQSTFTDKGNMAIAKIKLSVDATLKLP